MKCKFLLSVIIGFLLMTCMVKAASFTSPTAPSKDWTQGTGDTIYITPNTPGAIESTINSDTTGVVRNDPNRVYVLTTGLYEQNAGLNVIDSTGTLSIVGKVAAGAQRPVWYRNEVHGTELAANSIAANFVLKNIDYESMDIQGRFYDGDKGDFVISTFNKRVELDNNLISYDFVSTVNAQAVLTGLKFIARGNYFRNFLSAAQWWYGRALYAKVPVDTLIFENNTVSVGGLTLLQQNSLTNYALIDHNTFINNEKYPMLNPYYLEAYFTDNIFLNCGIAGEDSVNIMSSENVNHIRTGILNVDTLTTNNLVYLEPNFLKNGVKDTSQLGVSHIKWYAGDNIAVMEESNPQWNYYITGADPYQDGVLDSAASYLLYTSKIAIGPGDTLYFKPPFGVTNFKEVLVNSSGLNLAKAYRNIGISQTSNIEYTISGEALNFPTVALDTEKTKFWIQFNRSACGYAVPNISIPVAYPGQINPAARFAWGSFNPANIPGPNQKEIAYTSALGGITKFTDLPENFASTVFISQIDGLPVGSQIWYATPQTIPRNELTLVKAVYTNWLAGEDIVPCKCIPGVEVATGAPSSTLTIGPNPASGFTTITTDLPDQSNVLTVTDLSGNIVESVSNITSPYTLDASGLKNGIYIIVFKTDQNVLTSKLVKL
jgi:hypothetical protein